jgi:hypothetical protein
MPKRADHPGDDRLVRAPIVVERDEPCYAAHGVRGRPARAGSGERIR